MSQPAKYALTAIVIHWVVAALVLYNVFLPPKVEEAPEELVGGMMQFHMGIGLTILALMLLRLYWRLTHPAPELPADLPLWQKRAAKAVQWGLYAAVFAMVFLGVTSAAFAPYEAMGFGVIPLSWLAANNVDTHEFFVGLHEAMNKVIITLFVLHSAAALYHLAVKRDGVFRSMLPW